MGRPKGTDTYTEEAGAKVCERLAQVGSLRRVCAEDGMPGEAAVRSWIVRHPEFAEAYARAKEAGIDALVEEALDISDDGVNDWQEGKHGPMLNAEHVSRSKLRVEYRRWLAERMAPKKYGIKQDITSGGEPLKGAAVAVVERMTLDDWKKAHGVGDVEAAAG